MKKLRIVNKAKFYKRLFEISLYIIYILILTQLFDNGVIDKFLNYAITVYR